jgi:hypothetical protein
MHADTADQVDVVRAKKLLRGSPLHYFTFEVRILQENRIWAILSFQRQVRNNGKKVKNDRTES